MKHGIGVGLLVLAVGGAGFYFWEKRSRPVIVTQNALTDHYYNGYTNMMKVNPQYYNASSFKAEDVKGDGGYTDDPTFSVPTPWVLGSDSGNAMSVNPGWTVVPDSYSAAVSNSWLQEEAQGAHL